MKIHIPHFDKARVLVVGDVMLDRYWHGATSRISPEAPVNVERVEEAEDRPGGAANVALSIAALGAHADLVGVTGEDEAEAALARRVRPASPCWSSPRAATSVSIAARRWSRPISRNSRRWWAIAAARTSWSIGAWPCSRRRISRPC